MQFSEKRDFTMLHKNFPAKQVPEIILSFTGSADLTFWSCAIETYFGNFQLAKIKKKGQNVKTVSMCSFKSLNPRKSIKGKLVIKHAYRHCLKGGKPRRGV